MNPWTRRVSWAAIGLSATAALPGCTGRLESAPSCSDHPRLAIVAQAVPSAAYVPCVSDVPEGWTVTGFRASRGEAAFRVRSDRAGGRDIAVTVRASCDSRTAVTSTPRADGVRTGIALQAIAPRYAGVLFDVFAGGCITYEFDLPRGPHISLMQELQAIVGLMPRRQLRLEIREDLGVDIGS